MLLMELRATHIYIFHRVIDNDFICLNNESRLQIASETNALERLILMLAVPVSCTPENCMNSLRVTYKQPNIYTSQHCKWMNDLIKPISHELSFYLEAELAYEYGTERWIP